MSWHNKGTNVNVTVKKNIYVNFQKEKDEEFWKYSWTKPHKLINNLEEEFRSLEKKKRWQFNLAMCLQ